MKDLARRLPTAIVLLALIYVSVYFLPGEYFFILLFLIVSAAVVEFVLLLKPVTYSFPLIFLNGLLIGLSFYFDQVDLMAVLITILFVNGFFFLFSLRQHLQLESFVKDIGIHFMTIIYLYFPLFYIFKLRRLHVNFVFFLIAVIAIGDTGAYFIGKAVGKRKIYPIASPRKTLEGVIAAVLTAGLSGWLVRILFPVNTKLIVAMLTGAVIGLVSQLSDPIESLFKRAAGKKDSGSLLPGHGGILDRIDSYILCAPAFYYIIIYLWK